MPCHTLRMSHFTIYFLFFSGFLFPPTEQLLQSSEEVGNSLDIFKTIECVTSDLWVNLSLTASLRFIKILHYFCYPQYGIYDILNGTRQKIAFSFLIKKIRILVESYLSNRTSNHLPTYPIILQIDHCPVCMKWMFISSTCIYWFKL